MKIYDKNGNRIEAYDKHGNKKAGLTTWLEADMEYRPIMEQNARLYRIAIIEAIVMLGLITERLIKSISPWKE